MPASLCSRIPHVGAESTEMRRTKVDKPGNLQSIAFWLLLLSCITSGLLETHFLLGLWVTTGLIGTAGVLVYASNFEEAY